MGKYGALLCGIYWGSGNCNGDIPTGIDYNNHKTVCDVWTLLLGFMGEEKQMGVGESKYVGVWG